MTAPEVLRLDRCESYGITRSAVRAQLAGGRWQRVGPTVVVRHNGPLTLRQRWHVALLLAGGPRSIAALGAWTALELHGLVGWERPSVHVLVPRGRHVPRVAALDVVLHPSRRLAPTDRRHVRDLARTGVERSAVDAAAWSATDRSAAGVLAACVQQRLTSAGRLRRELAAVGAVRRVSLLRQVLDDLDGGATAVSEMDLVRFCRRHRLGTPQLQVVRRDAGGRRRYLDAVLTSVSGRPVHVEVDGGLHLAVRTYWDDMRRSNDLLVAGTSLVRIPSLAVRTDDPEAVRQLRTLLAR